MDVAVVLNNQSPDFDARDQNEPIRRMDVPVSWLACKQ